MKEYDVVVIGGGASGMLCSIEAKKQGAKDVLLIEKDRELGGTLRTGTFNISARGSITGKEYKDIIMKEFNLSGIKVQLNTRAINILEENEVTAVNSQNEVISIKGRSIILTSGSRERGIDSLNIVGNKCSGILTAGMAQRVISTKNMVLGKKIIIYGSSNLGMEVGKILKERGANISRIITRENADKRAFQLTEKVEEGCKITAIKGIGRISGVNVTNGEETTTESCDTLIIALPPLSDGIVANRSGLKINPETTGPSVDKKFMTSMKGVFACGNGIHIHNSIETLEAESIIVGKNVVEYLKNNK